ncbi:hypothetical protein [Gorillibacterium timonense]|uniref:hypothetical protein n=1 Tax=Gorillibacterium timonense TaxID=1689269 RepID=UPI00071E163A|nr:hypothetical protein [Gorillibacterium timonense]
MDNRNEDMVPEWQVKKETNEPEPAPPLQPFQPAAPYFGMSPLSESAPPAPVHSGLGIASFIMSILGIIGFVASFAIIISVVLNSADFEADLDNPELVTQLGLGGIGFLLAGLIMFVGLILGIVGLVQKNRKKGFAITGTILNGIVVGITAILMIIGLINYAAAA